MGDLISVIIPVYNTGRYLDNCIESILAQDYPDVEIIMVDDGSKDEYTLQKCDELASKHSNVCLYHKQNGGSASARNYGIERAKGKYIAFVDSDDIIDSSMYSVLYDMIVKDNVKLSICGIATEEDGKVTFNDDNIKDRYYNNEEVMHYFLLGHWHSACTILYSKDIIGSTRFPEGEVNEDYIFNYHILKKLDGISVTNKPLYHYLRRPGSNTSSPKTLKFLDWIKHTSFVMEDMKSSPLLRKEAEYQYLYSNIVLANSSLLTLNKVVSDEAEKLYEIVSNNLKGSKKMLRNNPFVSSKYRMMGYGVAYIPTMYKMLVLGILKLKRTIK